MDFTFLFEVFFLIVFVCVVGFVLLLLLFWGVGFFVFLFSSCKKLWDELKDGVLCWIREVNGFDPLGAWEMYPESLCKEVL